MEEILKNIGASKTFSISRNPKKIFENDEIFDATGRQEIDEIPAPMTTGKKPEINTKPSSQRITETTKKINTDKYNFSDFIANDRNIYTQRKILLQQEKSTANSSINLNTKGLLNDGDFDETLRDKSIKEIDVYSWPQCKLNVTLKMANYLDNDEMVIRLQKYYETRQNTKVTTTKRNRFWSALFPETLPKSSESRKRRIFPDPAYILHLSILKVRDERENEAIELLQRRLASLSLLKKTILKAMVNELFLRALDKGFDDLVILLIDSGFPDNFNYSIYGDPKSRRFPSYLLLAIGLGRLRVVQRMLEIQPNVQLNKGWFNGIRPLMMTQMIKKVSGKSLLLTQLLLKHGAEPNRSISYSTYLKGIAFRQLKMMTAMKKESKGDKIKKEKRVPRGRKEIYRNSRLYALDFACLREKYESAHLILSQKLTNDWLIKDEFCLLQLDNFELAADILQRAPELIKQRDPRGNTPLHYAAKNGRTDLISLYLRYTTNVDVLNWMHWTPLHEAAFGPHRATVQYLINCGADCSIKNVEGMTALQVARAKGISSEELYEFFHSADTIQRTKEILGELVIPRVNNQTAGGETGSRLLIRKFMKYPRKLWKKSFKFT